MAARTEISQVDLTILIDPALVLKMLALKLHMHIRVGCITFFEVWFVESGKIPLSDECRNNTTCMLCPCLSVTVKIKCLATRGVCQKPLISWNLQVAVKILRLQSHTDMTFKYFATMSNTKWVYSWVRVHSK